MESMIFRQVSCPYCGESIDLALDISAGDQAYVEDCSVCCRPIEVRLCASDDDWLVEVLRDDE